MGCAALCAPRGAEGQAAPGTETISALGVYDYFTCGLDPGLRVYLTMASNRHASEAVWDLYRAGKYAEPLGDCKYLLDRFPNHPRALHLMTEIAKATGETSMPLAYFEKALRLFPYYAYTHAQYGRYLLDIGATSAGLLELEEALKLDPNQVQALAWLAAARPGTAVPPEDSAKAGPPVPEGARKGNARGK
jgi:tetratricopeptide (TPR) repeat protein